MNTATTNEKQDTVRAAVRAHYAALAGETNPIPDELETRSGCACAPSCCGTEEAIPAEAHARKLGYSAADTSAVPEGANLNLGCGNPIALASIQPGETVVDLGSGAGFDCFLAANQLAGTGSVIGVDMTPAMISRARRNAARAGYANVEFRLGEIEALPVADGTADLVISNCVINLSPNKAQVFREAFRILKPGGRLSLADVVAREPLPPHMRANLEQWAGCVAGAETVEAISNWLAAAGFVAIRVTPRGGSAGFGETRVDGTSPGDNVYSAMIEARKP